VTFQLKHTHFNTDLNIRHYSHLLTDTLTDDNFTNKETRLPLILTGTVQPSTSTTRDVKVSRSKFWPQPQSSDLVLKLKNLNSVLASI